QPLLQLTTPIFFDIRDKIHRSVNLVLNINYQAQKAAMSMESKVSALEGKLEEALSMLEKTQKELGSKDEEIIALQESKEILSATHSRNEAQILALDTYVKQLAARKASISRGFKAELEAEREDKQRLQTDVDRLTKEIEKIDRSARKWEAELRCNNIYLEEAELEIERLKEECERLGRGSEYSPTSTSLDLSGGDMRPAPVPTAHRVKPNRRSTGGKAPRKQLATKVASRKTATGMSAPKRNLIEDSSKSASEESEREGFKKERFACDNSDSDVEVIEPTLAANTRGESSKSAVDTSSKNDSAQTEEASNIEMDGQDNQPATKRRKVDNSPIPLPVRNEFEVLIESRK
ncbi:hypothetical protein CPB83DRAFT_409357, partial [Crepidotus variabilis]